MLIILVNVCWFSTAIAGKIDIHDAYLAQIVRAFEIRPLPTKPFEETEKFKLGQALFFDPIISGNRDISCATCHLIRRGTSDGLAMSSGTGAIGLAEKRVLPKDRPKQPRNAPDLWNRDNNSVTSMFWDGRVEVLDPKERIYRNPFGHELPKGFDNLMAVQAIFPLLREDELLGLPTDSSRSDLPFPHGNLTNEFAQSIKKLSGLSVLEEVSRLLFRRLIGIGDAPQKSWHAKYRKLLEKAYPQIKLGELTIVDIANALSHFEEIAFATRNAPWDKYLRGDLSALDVRAKRGAAVFFGKGRCAVCHNGPLFSDFKFHSIGVINEGPGIADEEDLGRYYATKDPVDKYKFRTPPLRNVILTAPYFHNGSAKNLNAAILQHLTPLYYTDKYKESGKFLMTRDQIASISPILTMVKINLSQQNIFDLNSFLKSLTDDGLSYIERIIPRSVPSGLAVDRLQSKL